MLRIGNDIVDLNLAKTQSNWQRPGFLEKQFTQKEQADILKSENPFEQVWLFWSMKEAAYKCHVQQFKKRFFAPKKFLCKTLSNQSRIVQFNNIFYYIKYRISNNYIYTTATEKNDVKMVSESFFIDNNLNSTKIIDKKIQTYFSSVVQIKKNALGIPFIYQNDEKTPKTLSKTHHGNYGAFAFTLDNES